MNNKEFQATYFPLSEVVEQAAECVERLNKAIAELMGAEVEDIDFAVTRILEACEMDPATDSGKRYLASRLPRIPSDEEDFAEFVAYIVESIDKI